MPSVRCDECKVIVTVNADGSIICDFEEWGKQCVYGSTESPFLCPHLQKAISAAGEKPP